MLIIYLKVLWNIDASSNARFEIITKMAMILFLVYNEFLWGKRNTTICKFQHQYKGLLYVDC